MSNFQVVTSEIRKEDDLDPATKPSTTIIVALDDFRSPILSLEDVKPLFSRADEVIFLMIGAVTPDASTSRALKEITSDAPHHPTVIVVDLSHSTYPHLYQMDEIGTYQKGDPIAGECPTFPITSSPLVSNWSYVHELGLSLASSEWSILLRQLDRVSHPEYLRGVCQLLRENNRTQAHSLHQNTGGRSCLLPIVVKNHSGVALQGRTEPRTCSNATILDGGLLDTSTSVNEHLEQVKILYVVARSGQATPAELAQLAAASASLGAEWNTSQLAAAAVDACLAMSTEPEITSWACSTKGRLHETSQQFARASAWYERSLREYPNWKSALRLCRTRFMERRWWNCLEAYELAQNMKPSSLLLHDDGPENLDTSLVHVASAYDHLHMTNDARRTGRRLVELFPTEKSIVELVAAIG